GLVVDFAELDRVAEPVLARLDGADLVELLGTPSAEVIAVWLLDRLQPVVPGLASVQVWETERGSATAHARWRPVHRATRQARAGTCDSSEVTQTHGLEHEAAAAQRRTIPTLMGSQTLGGIGVASGIAVAAIVAAEVSGSDALSGLANTTQVLGGALFTVPIAAVMARHGRRPG